MPLSSPLRMLLCCSLFLGFASSVVNFHAADGSGYQFLGDAVLKVRPAAGAAGDATLCGWG
jgi:hypothetical protein